MPPEVIRRQEFPIRIEDDVFVVRRAVRALAEASGFDKFAVAALTTAASELARNTFCHGRGGVAVIEEVRDNGRQGLSVEFKDEGPGIADLPRVLAGGFSTVRSLGLGVSGSRRLVDDFSITSEVGEVGHGTCVVIRKWKRF